MKPLMWKWITANFYAVFGLSILLGFNESLSVGGIIGMGYVSVGWALLCLWILLSWVIGLRPEASEFDKEVS